MIEVGNLAEKTRLSWYQFIAKKHLWIYVILMVGCLSRSQEKASPRKMGLFPNGGV
jgi:hypothetical protein